MFLEVIIIWPAIYGTLLGAMLLGCVLYYLRQKRHKQLILQISSGNYEEIILKLEKLLVRPFPAMPKLERERIDLEIAILALFSDNYDKFNQTIQKITLDKLNYLKQVWLAFYSYQTDNFDDFIKYKSFCNTIYQKFTGRYKEGYFLYEEVLLVLSKEDNAEKLEELKNKITKQGGIFLKEYIKKISNNF